MAIVQSGSLWRKVNEWVEDRVAMMVGVATVTGTVDGGVVIGEGDEQRSVPKAIGAPMQPGQQVVLMRFGRREVAAFAVTRLGNANEGALQRKLQTAQVHAVLGVTYTTAGTRTLVSATIPVEPNITYTLVCFGQARMQSGIAGVSWSIPQFQSGSATHTGPGLPVDTQMETAMDTGILIVSSGATQTSMTINFRTQWSSGSVVIDSAQLAVIAIPLG